jgi:hypothetical protein
MSYLFEHLPRAANRQNGLSHNIRNILFSPVLQVTVEQLLLPVHYLSQPHLQLVSKHRMVLRTGTVQQPCIK